MSHVTFASRIVSGACGALIIGTAAFAQTAGACSGAARPIASGHTADFDDHHARLSRCRARRSEAARR